MLDEAGYVGTLATNSEFEIHRYLRLGDVVTAETLLESVSPEKRTRLGPGRFLTWVTTYRDGAGEPVGTPDVPHPEVRPGGPRRERTASLPERLAPDGHPGHAVLLGRPARASTADPALRRVRRAAPPAAADVPALPTRWRGRRSSPPGRGVVVSAVLPRHPQFPWFEDGYVVALVELDEGSRLVTNLVDGPADDDAIGLRGRGPLRPSSPASSSCRCSRPRARRDAERAFVRDHRGRRRAAAARDRRDRERDRLRRDRVARLHAGAPRPRLRAGAGRARHLHEHPLGHRLLQPVPHRLGRARRDGAPARDPPRRARVPGAHAHVHRAG